MTRLNEVLNYKGQYEENGILKNKLKITDSKKLEQAERMITSYKLANLYLNPGKQTFDVDHYLSIHKYLFEDIYDFAGKIRSDNICKQIPFCVPQLIYSNLTETLKKSNNMIKNIDSREKLVDFVTYLYSELDIIHPFREGNGRTEREFIRQYVEFICKNKNFGLYQIDYDIIDDKNEFINAVVIADAECDLIKLREYIDKIIISKTKTK